MSTYPETSDNWVHTEFASVELSDARLNRRCQEVADALVQQVGRPINQACEDWAATKEAYRLYAHEKVRPDQIIAPHQEQTVKRMQQHALVLAIQDTTFFNYTHHPATTGLGMIGKKSQKQRGFAMHTTLVVMPTGLPLGLLTQTFFTRPAGEPIFNDSGSFLTLPLLSDNIMVEYNFEKVILNSDDSNFIEKCINHDGLQNNPKYIAYPPFASSHLHVPRSKYMLQFGLNFVFI